MSTSYPSNLSDAEWECLQRHLPLQPKRGRPPTHSLRAIFDAIFYVLPTGACGFSVVPRRWVVERTFSWISRNRRMSKDYERKVQTSETRIGVAMIRLLVTRLARKNEPVPTPPIRA